MKRVVVWFAVVALIVGVGMPTVPLLNEWLGSLPTHVSSVQQLREVTVLVECADGGTGSGVAILRGGRVYVWTAGHVERAVKVHTLDGRVIFVESVVASALDDEYDLAVLLLEPTDWTFPVLTFADYTPELLQPVLHVGNWRGRQGWSHVSLGYIAAIGRKPVSKGVGDVGGDSITATAYPGSSGGGVFDLDYRVIGLLVYGWGDSWTSIVPVREMRRFAAAKSVEYLL